MIANKIQEAIPLLVQAIVGSNIQQANLLIDKFPRLLDIKDKGGRSLFMMAAYLSDSNKINYMASFYIINDPRINIHEVDYDGLNAYDWAVLGNNEFARRVILKLIDAESDR